MQSFSMKNLSLLLARILLSAIFIEAGYGKIIKPDATIKTIAAHGVPFADFFLVASIAFEIIGGLSILLGYKTRWGALALFLYLIPVTLIIHTRFSEAGQMTNFMKNLAIMGGFLAVANCGAGNLSLDSLFASGRKAE
jgi:putative oxidoreductase